MRRKSTSSMGALHPVLFFMFVYGISLVLAIFVCRTVYYSINSDIAETTKPAPKTNLSYASAAAGITALK